MEVCKTHTVLIRVTHFFSIDFSLINIELFLCCFTGLYEISDDRKVDFLVLYVEVAPENLLCGQAFEPQDVAFEKERIGDSPEIRRTYLVAERKVIHEKGVRYCVDDELLVNRHFLFD